jgi:hypothetical protein
VRHEFCGYPIRASLFLYFLFFIDTLKTKLQTKALTYQSLTKNKNYKHESRKAINPNLKLQYLSGNKKGNGEFSTPK